MLGHTTLLHFHINPGRIFQDLTANWKGEEFLAEGDLDLWGMNGINDVCTSNLFDGCRRKGTPADILNPVQSARLRTLENFYFT